MIILLVDDSPIVRASLYRQLQTQRGWSIVSADSVDAAWRLIGQHQEIAGVISDLNMPQHDGWSLLHRIRTNPQRAIRQLPVWFLSASDDPAERQRAADMGAQGYFVKGGAVADMADAMQSWYTKHPGQAPGALRTSSEIRPA